MDQRKYPDQAVSSWRFPVDNPQGLLPIDGALLDKVLADMCRNDPTLIPVACGIAHWFDECRAAALGG